MKLIHWITLITTVCGFGAILSAKHVSYERAGFSIVLPDGYEDEPRFTAAPRVYGFFKRDGAGGIGTALFLKRLDAESVHREPTPPTAVKFGVPVQVIWHGSKLDAIELADRLNDVLVAGYWTRVPLREGAIELIVLGSPQDKPRLQALLQELLSNFDVAAVDLPSSFISPAATRTPPSAIAPVIAPALAIAPATNHAPTLHKHSPHGVFWFLWYLIMLALVVVGLSFALTFEHLRIRFTYEWEMLPTFPFIAWRRPLRLRQRRQNRQINPTPDIASGIIVLSPIPPEPAAKTTSDPGEELWLMLD